MRLIRLTSAYIGELIAGRIGTRGPQLESCALTLGSFDGLHLGHQELIRATRSARERRGLTSDAVFTFLQHPRQLLDKGDEPFLLTTWREKLARFQALGCDAVVAADFCPELAALSYREFVEKFLVGYLGMRHLVAGYDLHLGTNRGGTARTLTSLGQELGFEIEVLDPVHAGPRIISSSAIRQAVAAGDMEDAATMLGRPFTLWGEVRPGDGRGRQIGYPTANIQPLDAMKLLPENGVYAVRVQVPGDVVGPGTTDVLQRVTETLPEVDLQGDLLSAAPAEWVVFGGMLNFGRVPTFHGGGLPEARIEAHIFGFNGDLRGRNVKVQWLGRLREEREFAEVEELVNQLQDDEIAARLRVEAAG